MRAVLIAPLLVAIVLGAGDVRSQPGAIAFVKVTQVAWLLARGSPVVLVDVRTREEYRARHIKGAVSIPLSSIRQHDVDLPRTTLVVLY